ncbi:hypothetical protein AAC387_Pa07g1670 [Persea americana]
MVVLHNPRRCGCFCHFHLQRLWKVAATSLLGPLIRWGYCSYFYSPCRNNSSYNKSASRVKRNYRANHRLQAWPLHEDSPETMFLVQLVGTIVASSVYFVTAWWLLTTVKKICHPDPLQDGSPWTCPGDDVFYNASIIWGVIGPRRMFGRLGLYTKMNWFFLIGLLLPLLVWAMSRMFPKAKWVTLINMPIVFGATALMPPARAVNYLCWGAVGIFFNFVVYRRYKGWWAKYNYVLSAGLDAGGLDVEDHCPLAHCPTAPGIVVEGCPVF